MNNLKTGKFWNNIARLILRNRIFILVFILLITLFLSTQWKNVRITNSEANLLPTDHPVSRVYEAFLSVFGEEGNLIVIGVKDSLFFTPEHIAAWAELNRKIADFEEVDQVVSVDKLPVLEKDTLHNAFEIAYFPTELISDEQDARKFRDELYAKFPFYKGLVFNKHESVIRSVIHLRKDIVNTSARKDFVLQTLIPLVQNYELENHVNVRVSGMPYVRSLNSQNTLKEIPLFIGGALFITSFIFFLFFRSFRATFISISIVIIGVMWAFGTQGLLGYPITALSAIIPPLIIVIGIPNCIFLINKYQTEVRKHGNQAKSLQRVISKIGNATLMTNLTTAAGFATFIFTKSDTLQQFGLLASINILSIFILSLLIIPVLYSFMQLPTEKHLKHLGRKWIDRFVDGMSHAVKNRRAAIIITAVLVLVISVIGINKIHRSGSLLQDMPQHTDFFQDIKFYEDEFGGIMPFEIVIDTRRPNGVFSLSTLNRMDELENLIREIPELSAPVSVVSLVKYAKQAFYNGNPNYYQLPTGQENSFIMNYVKNSEADGNLLENFVDSTRQKARITTFMKDLGTEQMESVENQLLSTISKTFPPERYDVTITGKAMIYLKGTDYLINNLVISLSLAILLISLFMAWSFRSFKMIIIALVPNMLPLIITAGMMGFLNIPLKPSTILVFSIAFGISVDDTIHFLAKYRQELIANKWKIRKSVFAALHETGVSMFYTSVVLFFGFSVFMLSSYGGTIALGGLVSITLLFSMTSNLLLLPSLLLSLDKSVTNKNTFRDSILEAEEE